MNTVTRTPAALTDIMLYGCLAEAGGRMLALALPAAGISDVALRALIAAARPAIAGQVLGPHVRLCIDDVIVRAPAIIRPDATIALFPPVSGG